MIKVLWLEDEIGKIEAFLDRTYMDGISVAHKDTANNFIAELSANLNNYDAVILDVMGVVDSIEEKPSSKAFSTAHQAVLSLKHKKSIPYFVLSAQLTKDENQGLREYIGDAHIYIKSKDEERLIADIKKAVAEQEDYILRNKFEDILSVFNDSQLGTKHYERIFNLIKWVEIDINIDDSEDQLTRIRKVIEAVFHSLASKGLVPTEITNSQGWLNGTSMFLANKHSIYHQVEPYVHPTACDSIFRLLNLIQDGSHAEGGLRLRVDEYIQSNKSDYLFKSCIFLLFDIIIWYKNMCDRFQDVEVNKTLWRGVENKVLEQMILGQDSLGNYHCGDVLLTYKEVKENGYNVGDKITILDIRMNTNDKTNQYYKKTAFKTQKA
jgi:hypothetical protein